MPARPILPRLALAALCAAAVLGLLWGVFFSWVYYDTYWEHREVFEYARGYLDENGVFHTDSTFVYGFVAFFGYAVALLAGTPAVILLRRRRRERMAEGRAEVAAD